ncbi:hypothetical protein GALL_528270 [mine drainage metagenome]|uniref:Uncharacterized protein n=1 Tax=mine drainage metagenome TaxID=410659 RepID=A0A1J5PDL6_9ZZZZ
MQNELDENANLNVEISNLSASPEELERVMNRISKSLGTSATVPKVTSMSNTKNGSRYTVEFVVLKPPRFNIDSVKDWLHSENLVGWRIDATFVRGDASG